MGSRLFLVDLTEDRGCVIELRCFPAKKAAGHALYLVGEGELRSGKNTNCGTDVFRGGKSTGAGIEVVSRTYLKIA